MKKINKLILGMSVTALSFGGVTLGVVSCTKKTPQSPEEEDDQILTEEINNYQFNNVDSVKDKIKAKLDKEDFSSKKDAEAHILAMCQTIGKPGSLIIKKPQAQIDESVTIRVESVQITEQDEEQETNHGYKKITNITFNLKATKEGKKGTASIQTPTGFAIRYCQHTVLDVQHQIKDICVFDNEHGVKRIKDAIGSGGTEKKYESLAEVKQDIKNITPVVTDLSKGQDGILKVKDGKQLFKDEDGERVVLQIDSVDLTFDRSGDTGEPVEGHDATYSIKEITFTISGTYAKQPLRGGSVEIKTGDLTNVSYTTIDKNQIELKKYLANFEFKNNQTTTDIIEVLLSAQAMANKEDAENYLKDKLCTDFYEEGPANICIIRFNGAEKSSDIEVKTKKVTITEETEEVDGQDTDKKHISQIEVELEAKKGTTTYKRTIVTDSTFSADYYMSKRVPSNEERLTQFYQFDESKVQAIKDVIGGPDQKYDSKQAVIDKLRQKLQLTGDNGILKNEPFNPLYEILPELKLDFNCEGDDGEPTEEVKTHKITDITFEIKGKIKLINVPLADPTAKINTGPLDNVSYITKALTPEELVKTELEKYEQNVATVSDEIRSKLTEIKPADDSATSKAIKDNFCQSIGADTEILKLKLGKTKVEDITVIVEDVKVTQDVVQDQPKQKKITKLEFTLKATKGETSAPKVIPADNLSIVYQFKE